MNSRLINVRLDSERLRKARALRESGIKLSDVVREAIDDRFLRLRPEHGSDIKPLIRRIYQQYPDPVGLPPRDYSVHDRAAVREAILGKLNRSR